MTALPKKQRILEECSSKQAAANILLARVLKQSKDTIAKRKEKDEKLTKSEIALLSFKKVSCNGNNGKL